MARTERTRGTFERDGYHLDRSARDVGCRHYGCCGWKRDERRRLRHQGKASTRRAERD